ncbi:MAG: TetR/AcrR family transcriptional regulator [Bifidobacteriaceae bacterium]|nr:TetR/AcrR family transcriptional regulator [Bifidobacteriaceae bacterium]
MRDPSATRRSLLKAGRAEFARHGLAGGRIARIAADAGVNKERIYANFGSKEALFEEVVDDALEDLLDLVAMPPVGATTPEAAADYVARVSAYHREHPELMRLVQWEALERRTRPDPAGQRAARYRAKVQALAERLSISKERAGPILVVLILLAAGPLAMPNITGLIMPSETQNPGETLGEWLPQVAAALVASAARPSP